MRKEIGNCGLYTRKLLSIETVLERAQTLGLIILDKDFKLSIINVFKELK